MQEVYKDIREFKKVYQVSNFGNVKSLDRLVSRPQDSQPHLTNRFKKVKGMILKPFIKKGNLYVRLYGKPHKVADLVAQTFLNPKKHKKKTVVKHIDGNLLNNNLENLMFEAYVKGTLSRKKEGKLIYMV